MDRVAEMKLEVSLGPDLDGAHDMTHVRCLVLTAAGDCNLADDMDDIRDSAPLLEELDLIGFRITAEVARILVRFRVLKRLTFTRCAVDDAALDVLSRRPEPLASSSPP